MVPFRFSGLTLGSTKEEAEKEIVFLSYMDNEGAAFTSAGVDLVLEGVLVMASLRFEREHGLQVIHGGFESKGYETFRSTFIRHFGPPDSSDLVSPSMSIYPAGTYPFKDSDFSIPVNSSLWYQPNAFISLQDRHTGRNRGAVCVATYRYMKRNGSWKMIPQARQALIRAGEMLVPPTDWTQEPCAFEGLEFGMPVAEVSGVIELKECIHSFGYGSTAYRVRFNIDSIETAGRLDFSEGRLISVSGDFDAASWEPFRDNFFKRYGKPHSQEKTPLDNGHSFEKIHWSSEWIQIGLSCSSRKGAKGGFHLSPS